MGLLDAYNTWINKPGHRMGMANAGLGLYFGSLPGTPNENIANRNLAAQFMSNAFNAPRQARQDALQSSYINSQIAQNQAQQQRWAAQAAAAKRKQQMQQQFMQQYMNMSQPPASPTATPVAGTPSSIPGSRPRVPVPSVGQGGMPPPGPRPEYVSPQTGGLTAPGLPPPPAGPNPQLGRFLQGAALMEMPNAPSLLTDFRTQQQNAFTNQMAAQRFAADQQQRAIENRISQSAEDRASRKEEQEAGKLETTNLLVPDGKGGTTFRMGYRTGTEPWKIRDGKGGLVEPPIGTREYGASLQAGTAEDLAPTKAVQTSRTLQQDNIKRAQTLVDRAKSAVDKGIGVWPSLRAAFDNVVGGLTAGALGDTETNDARQALREFRQVGKAALVNNPRFPVAEQANVDVLFPNPDEVFRNPATAKRKIDSLNEIFTLLQGNAPAVQVQRAVSNAKAAAAREEGAGSGTPNASGGVTLPDGVTQAEWDVMTPQERALFK